MTDVHVDTRQSDVEEEPEAPRSTFTRRQIVLFLVFTAVAIGLLYGLLPKLAGLEDTWQRIKEGDPLWLGAAFVFELLSFGGYIALLWLVGGRATPRLDLRASTEVTLGGAAATRLLPTGGVGGAALTLWAFRRAGLDARDATRTLLTFLVVLYSIFLGSIAIAGGLLSLGLVSGHAPLALTAAPATGAALAIVLALALATRRPTSTGLALAPSEQASWPARARAALQEAPNTLGAAVRDALALVRSADLRLLGAPAWWAFDAAVLWAMLHALGTPPSLAVVVLAYFVGQVANTLPIPGGVSTGMVGLLLAFGVEADLALVSVLAYRSVAIWLPAPIGLAALAGLRQTLGRWASEDAPLDSAPERSPSRVPVALSPWRGPEPALEAAA